MIDDEIILDEEEREAFAEEISKSQKKIPPKVNLNPENVEQGLAKLVLTLIELIRRFMEKEVIRRIEFGTLGEEEMERIGLALIKLEEKVEELKGVFGLENEELNLDLGPLGKLM